MTQASWDALRNDRNFIQLRGFVEESIGPRGNFRAFLNNHTTTSCAVQHEGAPAVSLAASGLDHPWFEGGQYYVALHLPNAYEAGDRLGFHYYGQGHRSKDEAKKGACLDLGTCLLAGAPWRFRMAPRLFLLGQTRIEHIRTLASEIRLVDHDWPSRNLFESCMGAAFTAHDVLSRTVRIESFSTRRRRRGGGGAGRGGGGDGGGRGGGGGGDGLNVITAYLVVEEEEVEEMGTVLEEAGEAVEAGEAGRAEVFSNGVHTGGAEPLTASEASASWPTYAEAAGATAPVAVASAPAGATGDTSVVLDVIQRDQCNSQSMYPSPKAKAKPSVPSSSTETQAQGFSSSANASGDGWSWSWSWSYNFWNQGNTHWNQDENKEECATWIMEELNPGPPSTDEECTVPVPPRNEEECTEKSMWQ